MGEQADYIIDDMMEDPKAFAPPVHRCEDCGHTSRYGGKCKRCGGNTRMYETEVYDER